MSALITSLVIDASSSHHSNILAGQLRFYYLVNFVFKINSVTVVPVGEEMEEGYYST
jgi:hypothetical protein